MKVLESLKIKDTIKKFDKWGCGCDWLRLSYKNSVDFFEDYFELLDSDNSNFATIDLDGITFTIQKIYCTLGYGLFFSCSYNDISVPCFEFVKFNENANHLFKSYGKLDFYGSLFRLVDIGFFEKSIFLTIKDLFGTENACLTRFDYRIDFFSKNKEIPVPTREEFFSYKHSQSNYDPKYKGDTLTNWLLGTKDNGRYAIRYYDKLLDSDKKTKLFLYQDYFDYKCVHRLEFELQRNFLKGFCFYDFYYGLVQDKIESILGLNDNLFNGSIFYQYDDTFKITDKNKTSYLKRYNTSTLRLAKNGINPLIQVYKTLFYDLEEDDFQNNINDFLDFIGSDRQQYRLLYERKKQLFLDLHKI